MLTTAMKVLNKIEEAGYQSYIVGGFVRDHILGIESNDIDICTSATPKELRDIFQDACLPHEEYGSVTLMMSNVRFEITTFRKEYTYLNNRKPIEIAYIEDLREDLLRRDFTMNTLVMNSSHEILDLLDGIADIEKRTIQSVGNSYDKFSEDSLRILRAIRFATSLHFTLGEDVKEAILKTKGLLRTLSYERKKEELERIFISPNVAYGVSLLLELGLEKELEIMRIGEVPSFEDLMGVWAYLDVMDIYPFSRNEREQIIEIQRAFLCDPLDSYMLYYFKLYTSSVVAGMKGLSKKEITKRYVELPIHLRKDISITSEEICELLHQKPGPILKEIWVHLEQMISRGLLVNEKEVIQEEIIKKYL